jgi:osmotically-inducible protein OsmY
MGGYEGSRSQESYGRSQYGSPYGSQYGRGSEWGQQGRQDWGGQGDYDDESERYGGGTQDYGYNRGQFRGMEGYEPGDYSYSGRGSGGYGTERDWSSESQGSYGQGSQQGRMYGQGSQGSMYGQSSSHEPWSEGSYQGRSRGVTQGNFGESSQRGGSQSQGGMSRNSFAGRGPQGYKRSDERITEDINEALTRDHQIDATNIQVEVQNGEVTLKGTVSDREAKRRAEDIAESCSGVKEVQNQVRVKREDESSSETSSESSKRDKGDDKQRHRVAS